MADSAKELLATRFRNLETSELVEIAKIIERCADPDLPERGKSWAATFITAQLIGDVGPKISPTPASKRMPDG
jgi:hypothetical protein